MSTKYIRIEGEAVSAIEETVHRRTTLPEWLAAMSKLSPTPLTTPVLPEGCALYAQKGTQQLVVINQPAAVKKVIWRTTVYRDPDQRNKTRWQLAVPPHVFVLVFQRDAMHSSHLYFVPAPVTGEKDMLFRTTLANVYSTDVGFPGTICSGDIRLDVKAPLAARCQQYINSFWESEFNDDVRPVISLGSPGYAFSGTLPAQFRDLHAWDKATTDTPNFLAEMTWPFSPLCTLADILNDRWVV